MAGAVFVRADLHVHTFADNDVDPHPDLDAYVQAAIKSDLGILAVTDHNTSRFARAAVQAASGTQLLVLPGIEISTHDGHLLGLFSPLDIDTLEAFANPQSLSLTKLSDTEQRSSRSMIDLVNEIFEKGGLAIAAHVDTADGIHERLSAGELQELLTNPGLAGLEFARAESLAEWFTDQDENPDRLAAWKARQGVEDLRNRGLARLMSSDAHSVDKVGQDRTSRTLTRIRIDDLNFEAVRNALLLNPKARCKAEGVLPVSYPHITQASFRGGFLDGLSVEFSPNLNCFIGGRGSGKSTALLAIRAALGANLSPEEDADEIKHMPDETTVWFVDNTGSERKAVRARGESARDADSGSPISLRLADLGQDESGRLARGYESEPSELLEFLNGFVTRHEFEETEQRLLEELAENGAEVKRTFVAAEQLRTAQAEHDRLQASLTAAQKGKVEEIAEWATYLAAQAPLLEKVEADLREAMDLGGPDPGVDLDGLASEFGVDLSGRPARFLDGDAGLRAGLGVIDSKRQELMAAGKTALEEAGKLATEALERWKADQADLRSRLDAKQKELEDQGLKVQAGAVRAIAERLNAVKITLVQLRTKQAQHKTTRQARADLLEELNGNRDALYEARRATLRRIYESANEYSDGLTVRVHFVRRGLREEWARWLSSKFAFRSPRVYRLADKIAPHDFAKQLLQAPQALLTLTDDSGEPFFAKAALDSVRKWDDIFKLETMRLEDRPVIEVQEAGSPVRKVLSELLAGQQRSVLLSLLLCAERSEPTVIDQPEDHLDAQYIATAVVRHLEAAKERRQVVLATHSANLVVLGDTELVIPLEVLDGHGAASDAGAADRPETRRRVCDVLEGGVRAFERRGERYGFRFAARPPA